MPGTSQLSSLLRGGSDLLQSYLRMLGAVATDVAEAADGGGPADPFDARDPDYIRETLPALQQHLSMAQQLPKGGAAP